jgi:hypothetical protein
MNDEFLHDWQSVESTVFGLILKHAGAIKKPNSFFNQIDEETLDQFAEFIDAEIYWKIKGKYGHFKDQLKYLVDNGVIGQNLREFIWKVSRRRGAKVHGYKQSITDMERPLFALANQLLLHIQFCVCDTGITEAQRKRQIEKMDTHAKAYLGYLKLV